VPSPLARPRELASVLSELARAPFEILAAHAATPPGRGLLAPGRDTDVAGAARPALLLPPPAQVRFALGQGEELWLTGGVAVDQSMEEAAAARYPGHAVLFELHLDGRPLFRARVALSGSPRWVELGDGAGLALGAAKELSLRTRLVDAEDHEVVPPDALRVGFGGLCLERRETVARASASRTRPNLVFVLLDTLRADRTSAYGYARPTTPHLAELAARGTLFAEAHASASWTWPSVASLFTGLTPEEHGVVDAVRSFLPESLETLAEALQRAGFSTAGWSGSPLIVPSKQFDQGFEFFDASRAGFLRRADLLVPPALEWLERVRDQRFFLYLHLMEPHAPYLPLEEPRRAFAPEVPDDFDAYDMLAWQWDLRRAGFDGAGRARTDAVVPAEKQRWASDLYDAGVSSADHWVGVVLAKLAELELTEETIVVVTSDHGEELFEHGLFTHGHSLHRELVRVPLIVAGPGIPVGERVAGLRSTNALGATLLRRLGLEPGSQWPAVDLFADEAETVWFSTRQGWWNGRANQALYGLRRGALSLVFAPTGEPWGGGEPGSVALFDRALDPAEEQDLAARRPADTAALRALLEQRLVEFDVGQVDPLDTPDAATLDMLRDIGYLGR
ncbi:MAG: sulfatase, partial [Planctomycetota bacterium]